MKKEITFFYLNEVEKWATENIFNEASEQGYKVKYSKNLKEKCEIGFYPQDKYVKPNSKLSVVMLHGMDQGRVHWPNHWSNEPWNKYDIGFLPGESWSKRWHECSWDPFAHTRKGVYEVGWPKSDKIFEDSFSNTMTSLKDDFKLKYRKSILYAPSFESNNQQIEIGKIFKDLEVNLLIKHWLTDEDSADFNYLKKNIDEANKYLKTNIPNAFILNPHLDFMKCLALSDILITDESSVLYEGFLFNVPTISVSDFVMRTHGSKPARLVQPSKECYRVVPKSNLLMVVNEILDNKQHVFNEINEKKKYHYSNLGKSSKIIMSILTDIISDNIYENNFKLKPKFKIKNYILFLRPIKNIIIKFLSLLPLGFIKIFSKNYFLKSQFNKIRKF